MTTPTMDTWRQLAELDEGVKVGDTVQVRWTWSHGFYHAKAQITKVNAKSVRARLLHPVAYAGSEGLPTGRELVIPRLWTTGWSINNCFLGKSLWRVRDKRGVYAEQEVEAFSDVDARLEALPLMFGCPVSDVDGRVVEETFLETTARHLRDL